MKIYTRIGDKDSSRVVLEFLGEVLHVVCLRLQHHQVRVQLSSLCLPQLLLRVLLGSVEDNRGLIMNVSVLDCLGQETSGICEGLSDVLHS